MHSILKDIVNRKYKEVEDLKNNASNSIEQAKNICVNKSFRQTIRSGRLSIIGEIKRRSPSKGNIASIPKPLALLKEYIDGGVSAVSVLTDKHYFSGSIEDLTKIADQLKNSKVPVLRKDFIVDEIQIIESVLAGANAVLLITAVLKEKTQELLKYANDLGVDAIVEVHNESEMKYAIQIGAEIIGVNNRDLHTFEENIDVCLNLIKHIPKGILTIAESAIKTPTDIKKINAAGFDAVLIGEALVRSEKPSRLLNSMRKVL